jgi:SAM-dependent methyltransferase
VSFETSAAAYDQFMGRYSRPLARALVRRLGDQLHNRVADIGCGPGALTEVLVDKAGPAEVIAIDPSRSFVTAARDRWGVTVVAAKAERLPFADAAVDAALAQLVVHFMSDPVAGLSEMARITRPDGALAASVWDHAGGHGPLAAFWRAAAELDPAAPDESGLPGTAAGQLATLARAAGWSDVIDGSMTVEVEHPTFDQWWEPFTLGVGPAGGYVAGLTESDRARLRGRCRDLLSAGPFVIAGLAWTVVGRSAAHRQQ